MRKFSLGIEAIDFQTDNVFDNIVDCFKRLKKANWKNIKILEELNTVVLKRFGIKITTILNEGIGAFTIPPTELNQAHVFFNDKFRQRINWIRRMKIEEIEKIFNDIEKFKEGNTVDLQTAKVSGVFSENACVVGIGYKGVYNTLEPEEISAIYLHEIGHLFTWYEQCIKSHTTNMVLSELCLLTQSIDKQKKEIIIKRAENLLEIPADSLVLVNESTDEKVTATIFMDCILKKQKSSTGSVFYDYTAREQMADQFVSRLGGGRHLISALDKLFRAGHKETTSFDPYKSLTTRIIMQVAAIYLNPIVGLIMAWYLISELNNASPSVYHEYGYDNDKVRLLRIKNDMTIRLKNITDDKQKKIIIDSIDDMDKIIKEAIVYESALTKVAKFLNLPTMKKKQEVYTLHKELEELAFNDLFIKSEKLRLV